MPLLTSLAWARLPLHSNAAAVTHATMTRHMITGIKDFDGMCAILGICAFLFLREEVLHTACYVFCVFRIIDSDFIRIL